MQTADGKLQNMNVRLNSGFFAKITQNPKVLADTLYIKGQASEKRAFFLKKFLRRRNGFLPWQNDHAKLSVFENEVTQMNFVEKHSKLLAVALCLGTCGPILSTVHAYEVQPGWHSNGEVSYYVTDNHQRAKGLTTIDTDTYYFNQNGEMQVGWQNVNNQTFYFDNNGKAVTGKSEIQGTTYNFQQTGSLTQGWNDDGSYYNEKGFKVASSWIHDEGYKYYFDENGAPVKSSWMDIDGSRYYFDQDGHAATGEVDVDGTLWYTDDEGILRTGWQEKDGVRYFYNDNGSLNTDPFKDIDGVTYAFNEDGSLLTNTEKDGYLIDANGVASVIPETPAVPEETPAETPVETPAEQPVETPAEQPAETPVETPAEQPVETPVETPAETPIETPAETPIETPIETPVETPAETPIETPVETPVVNEPEQAPVEEVPAPEEWIQPEEPTVIEPEPEPAPTPAPVQPEPEPEPAPAPVAADTNKAQAIYNAAMAQLGWQQDCTMLATNALKAVGINFHGWPEEYAALGDWTSNPVPGDLVIYSGHVAVYAGNYTAVHGGFNGRNTVVFSIDCQRALIGYIHVR